MDIKRDVSLRPLLALAAQLALTGCLTGSLPAGCTGAESGLLC